ncbi:MAG: hypothetical protein RLZZ224_1709 [Verrucomicrobiota bacterium]|jgi:hypothetical protein
MLRLPPPSEFIVKPSGGGSLRQKNSGMPLQKRDKTRNQSAPIAYGCVTHFVESVLPLARGMDAHQDINAE